MLYGLAASAGVTRITCFMVVAGAIAWPAAASAATVDVTGHSLVIEAAPAEANAIVVSGPHRGSLTVSDPGAPLTPMDGCARRSAHKVSCSADGITLVVADAGDLDDSIVNDTALRSRLDGGEGTDRVIGGSRADRLYGGDGEDTIHGRGGRDIIRTGGFWADDVRCGGGRDTVFADWLDRVARNCESVTRPPKA